MPYIVHSFEITWWPDSGDNSTGFLNEINLLYMKDSVPFVDDGLVWNVVDHAAIIPEPFVPDDYTGDHSKLKNTSQSKADQTLCENKAQQWWKLCDMIW